MKLACKDVSGIDCSFVASGKTATETKKALFDHASRRHADVLSKIGEKGKADLEKKMDSLLAVPK
jgi:predicted small metal-binding protein